MQVSVASRVSSRSIGRRLPAHWSTRRCSTLAAETGTEREYQREVLAEWVDDAGAYFTSAELEAAVDDVALTRPEDARGLVVCGGVDWGFSSDANALAVIASANEPGGKEITHRVVWLDERSR